LIVGIDLAGSERRPTGVAFLGSTLQTCVVFSDEEILCTCEGAQLAAIDAPLSLPRRGKLREGDRELIRMGFRVFPPLFSGMKSLTHRGIRLATRLRRRTKVIEVHPRTSGLILFGTDQRGKWVERLREFGYHLESPCEHELDAALAALTGKLYLEGKTKKVGNIVIPREAGLL
jgi:predicted nuclease with RNAse H fold